MSFKDEQICLLFYSPQTKKIEINEEALGFLSNFSGPLSSLCVIGPVKDGKSYLMNRMMMNNKNQGFKIESPENENKEAQINIWCKPLKRKSEDGESNQILLIDTNFWNLQKLPDEGFKIYEKFLLMTILMSSCLIYNKKAPLDETDSSFFELFDHSIRGLLGEKGFDAESLETFFPYFVCVLRDFPEVWQESLGAKSTVPNIFSENQTLRKQCQEKLEKFSRYFKEKDIFTLTCPVGNEQKANIQTLEKMEVNQLRPEFVLETMKLRTKLLQSIPIKLIFSGHSMNGEVYARFIRTCVDFLNHQGTTKVSLYKIIDSFGKKECEMAFEIALEHYEGNLKEYMDQRMPVLEEELKKIHKAEKEAAFMQFRQRAIGNQTKDYEIILEHNIKEKFTHMMEYNEQESHKICTAFILQEFVFIERKLKRGDYSTFLEYERELKIFYSFYLENAPLCPSRKLIILEFLHKALTDGANHFLKKKTTIPTPMEPSSLFQSAHTNENPNLTQIHMNYLRNSMASPQLKNPCRDSYESCPVSERNCLLEKIELLEIEKRELYLEKARNLDEVRKLKEELDNVSLKCDKEKENNLLSEIEFLKQEINNGREHEIEVVNEYKLKVSSLMNEIACNTQKLTQVKTLNDKATETERILREEIDRLRRDSINEMADLQLKYDAINKNNNCEREEEKEKIKELEKNINELEQFFENERNAWRSKEELLISNINDLKNTLINSQNECEKFRSLYENIEKEEIDHFTVIREQLVSLEENLRLKDKEMKEQRNMFDKDRAVLTQKLELTKMELDEFKKRAGESKSLQDVFLQAIELNEDLSCLRSPGRSQISRSQELICNHREEIERMKDEIRRLILENEDLKMSQVLGIHRDSEKERRSAGDRFSLERNEYVEKIKALERKLDMIEKDKSSCLQNLEEFYKERIRFEEIKTNEAKNEFMKEREDLISRNEEHFAQFRRIFEEEKYRLNERIREEKERAKKEYQEISEEFDRKLEEEKSICEELRIQLIEKTRETECLLGEFDRKKLSIESDITKERDDFLEESSSLKTRVDELQRVLESKNRQLERTQEEIALMFVEKQKALDSYSRLLKEVDTEKQKKLEEFQAALIQERESSKAIISTLSTDKEKLLKLLEDNNKVRDDEAERASLLKIKDLSIERNRLRDKYKKSKRALKDLEMSTNNRALSLEKEIELNRQKIFLLEKENSTLLEEIQENRLKLESLKKIEADLRQRSREKSDLESKIDEVSTTIDRERLLWATKEKFLNEQRDDAKKDALDSRKRLEELHENMLKIRNADKEEIESNQVSMIKSLERRTQMKVSELTEQYEKRLLELELKEKEYSERLKKFLEEKSELEMTNRSFLNKNEELLQREKILRTELEQLKTDKKSGSKISIDLEKEMLKNKVFELEQQLGEAESRRTMQLYEHEREKSRWTLDKENLQVGTSPKRNNITGSMLGVYATMGSMNANNSSSNQITSGSLLIQSKSKKKLSSVNSHGNLSTITLQPSKVKPIGTTNNTDQRNSRKSMNINSSTASLLGLSGSILGDYQKGDINKTPKEETAKAILKKGAMLNDKTHLNNMNSIDMIRMSSALGASKTMLYKTEDY